MPMNTLRTALLALVVAAAFRAAAQPVYTFRVKVGITANRSIRWAGATGSCN